MCVFCFLIVDIEVIKETVIEVSSVEVSTNGNLGVDVVIGICEVATNLLSINIQLQDIGASYQSNMVPSICKYSATRNQLSRAIVNSDRRSIEDNTKTLSCTQTTHIYQRLCARHCSWIPPTFNGEVVCCTKCIVIRICCNQISCLRNLD